MQLPAKMALASVIYAVISLALVVYSWKLTQIHSAFGEQIRSNPIIKHLATSQVFAILLICIVAPIVTIYPSLMYGLLVIPIMMGVYVLTGSIRSIMIHQNHLALSPHSNQTYFLHLLKDVACCGGIIGSLVFYSNWISCGCWENKSLKIGATILGYILSMSVLSAGKIKTMKLWALAIYGISAAVFCAFMGHYIMPFRMIPNFSDNILMPLSSIPLIGTTIYMMACLNSQSNIVYKIECN